MRSSRPIPKEPALHIASASDAPDVFADPSPSSRPPEIHVEGDLIADKYRLVRRIGTGGMGEVWVAHNEALAVKVAIKLIGRTQRDRSFVSRLAQEAQAAASLGHPAIIRVFDFGKTAAGSPFIVMELLHGEDLSSVLDRRGSISEIKAVQSLLPVIHALAAAHEKGIVHRDLKPANIFMARMDAGGVQPKLLDFGVAKSDRNDFERVTHAGVLVGSPAYMSPEQARGEDVDRSADLWAICVVLYELITGTLPFNGENYNQLLWAIAHDEPVPITTQLGGDAKLWAILVRGFCKQRARRWESMLDLGEELARWLHDQGVREDIVGSSLQTAWLDRSNADNELFGTGTLTPSEAPASLARRPLRGEDAIPTLPGSFSGESQRFLQQRQLRRRVALALAGGGGLVALIGSFWLAGRSTTEQSAASPAVSAKSRPSESRADAADSPVVEPVAHDEQDSATSVAPLEEVEDMPKDAGADTASVPHRIPGPLPRPRHRPQPNARSWEKLKNPFD